MDIRLIICGLAVAVAMFALAWDYFYPFPASRYGVFMIIKYFQLISLLYLQFSEFKSTQFQANIDRLCWYILLHDDGSDNIHNVQGKGDICRCCRKRPCWFRSRLFMGSFVQHEKVSVCYLITY